MHQPRTPTVPPTSVRRLVLLAIVVGVLAWTVLHVIDVRSVDALSGEAFAVPWTLPLGVLAVAGGVFVSARAWRRRLSGDRDAKAFEPIAAARSLVLAKASSHAGALLVGGYAGYALLLAPGVSGELRRGRFVSAALTAFASLLLVLAGLWLERTLRVPPDKEAAGASGR